MIRSHKISKSTPVFQIPDPKDNFGLTKREFDQFLESVKNGDESLFVRVFNVHFKTSVKYIQNKFSISNEGAYDVCMDTLVEFRAKLKADKIKYGNLRYLFTKMAVNMYLDSLKRKKKVKNAISVFMGEHYKNNLEDKEFLAILNRSIELLEKPQREMIKDIFYHGKLKEQILEEYNITYDTFRKRKQRSLGKLKTVFLGLINKMQ